MDRRGFAEVEVLSEARVGAAAVDGEFGEGLRDEFRKGEELLATFLGGFQEVCEGAFGDDGVEGGMAGVETFRHDEDGSSHGFAKTVEPLAALVVHPGCPGEGVVLFEEAIGDGVATGLAVGSEVGREDGVVRGAEPRREALATSAPSADAMEDEYAIADLRRRQPCGSERGMVGCFDRDVLSGVLVGNDLTWHVEHLQEHARGEARQRKGDKEERAGGSDH